MREDDINVLLEQLKDLGFEVDKFAEELRRKAKRPGSSFTIEQTLGLGKAALHCKLRFIKKQKSDKFLFHSYQAYCPGENRLRHKVIDGLDTAELETRMQGIDWNNLEFNSSKSPQLDRQKLVKTIKEIFEDLEKLSTYTGYILYSEKEKQECTHLSDMLRIRYLLDTVFETPDLRQTARQLRPTRTFYDEHVHAAFEVVSGNCERIMDLLHDARLYCIENHIAEQLSIDKKQIAVHAFERFSEGMLHYRIPLVQMEERKGSSERYYLRPIEATLIPYSKIDFKKKISGVSIGRLDKKMKKIDWWREYKKVPFSEMPQHWLHSPAIARAIKMLKQIESDETGKEIALQLKLKYWIGTPLIDAVIAKARLEQKKIFHRQTFKWPSDPEIVVQNLYAAYRSRIQRQQYCRIKQAPGRKKGL